MGELKFCYDGYMVWLLVIILLIIIALLISERTREKAREKVKQGMGLCNFALEQSIHKQKNKQKVLDLLQKETELTNEQIRKSLRISDRSVVRYMDELEKERKVKQLGSIGRGVSYKLAGS